MSLHQSNVVDNTTTTVFIVDDDSVSRTILSEMVKSIGPDITVKTFQSALAALTASETSTPDLIITDYKMPIVNGIEFTRQVRQRHSCQNIPIIMITIMEEKSILYEALEIGVTDFLSKPLDHNEGIARCRNLLALGKYQSKLKERSNLLEKRVTETTEEILVRERETLNRLTKACAFKDCITGEHLLRIGRISYILALEMGLDSKSAEILETASPLHDIGKLAIPDEILMKKDKLTNQEFDVMKTHTLIGHELLKDSPSPYLQIGALIALNHHEKFDGSGYPYGISGDEIPIEAGLLP